MNSNHPTPSNQARRKVRVWNAAQSAATDARGWREARTRMNEGLCKVNLPRVSGLLRQSVSGACAPGRSERFVRVVQAQVQNHIAQAGGSVSSVTRPRPNPSIERTATGWPRYARCSFSASRGQPAAAAHVKR